MVRYCLMCTLIYKPFKTEYGEGEVLDRCIPKEGVWLWEIQATYAKQHPRFNASCSWTNKRGSTGEVS